MRQISPSSHKTHHEIAVLNSILDSLYKETRWLSTCCTILQETRKHPYQPPSLIPIVQAVVSLSKVLACLLLSLLVLHQLVEAADATVVSSESVDSSAAKKIDCGAACAARCQLASRQKICKRACGTCCARCNCVPPGTAGNRDVCPCYASMTTHGGRLKCP